MQMILYIVCSMLYTHFKTEELIYEDDKKFSTSGYLVIKYVYI
jgi:hypothetical protein